MSRANPLWSAPRIHGELLKLGVEVSQATDGRHLPHRRNAATFKLLYAVPDRCVTGTQGTYGYYAEQLGKLGLCIEGQTRGQTRRFLHMIAPHSLSIGSDEMLNADSRLDPRIKDERTSAELAEATKVFRNNGKLGLLGRQIRNIASRPSLRPTDVRPQADIIEPSFARAPPALSPCRTFHRSGR